MVSERVGFGVSALRRPECFFLPAFFFFDCFTCVGILPRFCKRTDSLVPRVPSFVLGGEPACLSLHACLLPGVVFPREELPENLSFTTVFFFFPVMVVVEAA